MTEIVVINDDRDGGALLQQLLSESGWEGVTCCSAQNLYQMLSAGRKDLIILDVGSRAVGKAWDLITLLQLDGELSETPVIVCSGPCDELLAREEWLRDHHISILSKPFDLDELHRTVHLVLDG